MLVREVKLREAIPILALPSSAPVIHPESFHTITIGLTSFKTDTMLGHLSFALQSRGSRTVQIGHTDNAFLSHTNGLPPTTGQ